MGGEVFVGVRRSNGKEHLSLRWTNAMPYYFLEPEFFNEGEVLEEFIARATPKNEWPKAKTVKSIQPSEYGVILIDFQTKEVLSRQDYCCPDEYLLMPTDMDVVEAHKKIVALYELGLVNRISMGVLGNREMPKSQLRGFLEGTKLSAEGYRIHVKPGELRVHHASVRARDCWKLIRAWVQEAGWTSLVRKR